MESELGAGILVDVSGINRLKLVASKLKGKTLDELIDGYTKMWIMSNKIYVDKNNLELEFTVKGENLVYLDEIVSTLPHVHVFSA